MKWDLRPMAHLRKALFVAGFLTILLAVPCEWLLARHGLLHIKNIDRAPRSIMTGSDLTRRVPVRGTGDELDELAGTLNLMLERIEGYIRELSDMMDNTAHDFKTPLARIRSLAEEALMDTDPQNIQGNLVQITEETDRFLSLINAVLDISEARTGLLRLRKDRVELTDLVKHVLAYFEGACREKGMEVRLLLPEQNDVSVMGDRSRLFQAVVNIVDNAVKFSPPGGVLQVAVSRDDRLATVTVEDSGPGIPADQRAKVFERFYKGSVSGSSEGRGVGLSLAKAYVEAHGGEIHVGSSSLGGSLSCLRLP